MKGKILVVVVLILFSGYVFAQSNTKPQVKAPMSSRIFVGGSLGLQFGNITLIDVSPLIGYWFTEKLAGGIGFTYQYYKDNRYIPEYSTDIYGTRMFGRYFILDNIYGHAEYEWLNYEAYSILEEYSRINLHNILLGGGYRQWLSDNAFLGIEILWNVNESIYSLYQNPIIRVGVNVGI